MSLATTVGEVVAELEGRQAELADRIVKLEADLAEAKRDPLADLVRLPTLCERYPFTAYTVREWIRDAAENGAHVWIRQEGKGRNIWIDLHQFHQWFEDRFGYSVREPAT